MTMPHLSNCPHSPDGWCLDCVKELHAINADLLAALEFYTSICGNTCSSVTQHTAMEMYAQARAAIAIAKGETP